MRGKIKGYLDMIGETQAYLADFLDISETTLSFKINGTTDFKRSEMIAITNLFKEKLPNMQITMDEIFLK